MADEVFTCPQPNGIFPNEDYCYKYWSCGDNVPFSVECPEDLLFDIPHSYCDFPQTVDCGDRKPRPQGNETTTKPPPTGTTQPYTGSPTTKGDNNKTSSDVKVLLDFCMQQKLHMNHILRYRFY
jgi:hypothetical protein